MLLSVNYTYMQVILVAREVVISAAGKINLLYVCLGWFLQN